MGVQLSPGISTAKTYMSTGITCTGDTPIHSVTTTDDGLATTLTLYGMGLSGALHVTMTPGAWRAVIQTITAELAEVKAPAPQPVGAWTPAEHGTCSGCGAVDVVVTTPRRMCAVCEDELELAAVGVFL